MGVIKNSDVFDPKLFKEQADDAKILNDSLNIVEKSLKDIAKLSVKAFKGVNPKTASDIKKVNEAVNKSKVAVKNLGDFEVKRAEATRLAEIRLAQNREKAFDKFERQQKKSIKTAQKARKSTIDNANAFKKLSKQTNAAQARFKRLAAQYGVTSKAAINAGNTFRKLDDRLRKINKSARDGRRDVGRYGLALQKVKGSLSTGLGALGITAGIAGLGRVMGNVIGIFSGFEKSNSQLQAVLGNAGTKGNMDLLKQSAKELGATTAFTAAQVTGLQIEFAKLGFDPAAIDNATEATLALAAAAGVDLAEAASVAGATLGGFGLDAAETGRVTDVMAKSFSISALDMEKFKESMKSAAPAAKAVGVNVEKTTALLGTLANAGISGSKAGNNLKTTFINLNAAGLTLEEGLEKVANSEDKLGTAAKLVGKNAAASFLVLADGVDTTKQLEEGLNNAAGAAQEMADIQLDNLAGSITILGSAWEGFILSLEDGEGKFSSLLRTIVDVATELLSMATGTAKAADELDEAGQRVRNIANAIKVLAKVVGALLVSFIAYKATIKAINIATKLYTLTTNALRIAQIALKGGLKGATKAMKGFNTASKANIIGALVALLALAVTAYYAFRDAAKEAADAERDRQAAVAEGEAAQKSIDDRIEILNDLKKAGLVTLLRDIEAKKESLKTDEDITKNLLRQAELKKFLEEGNNTETDPLTGEVIDLTPFLEDELRLNIENTAALQGKTDALEEQRIVVQKRLDQLNKQLGLSKKEDEATKKEIKETKDLIKIREAQLRRTKDLEAINEVDIIAREKRINIIQEEIKRLKALGKEKEKQKDDDEEVINTEFDTIEQIRRIRNAREEDFDSREKELRRIAQLEIDTVAETANEELLIKERLFDDLADLDKERLDAEKKAAAERQRIKDEERDAIQALANKTVDIYLEGLAKKDAARIKDMNSQISRQEELINTLRQNAVEGTEKALAFEEARLEKQRLAKQREEERQAKRNEAIALAQTFLNQVAAQSKSPNNPDTAIAEAFKNTFLAKAIAKGLLGFYEGTDEVGSTGTETKFSSGRDGYVVKVDKGEKIFNSKQSDRLNKAGFGDRSDVVDLVEDYATGNTWDFMPRLQTFQTSNDIDLSKVVESNERVVRAIESIPPAPSYDLSGLNMWIETRFTAHGKEMYQVMLKHFKK